MNSPLFSLVDNISGVDFTSLRQFYDGRGSIKHIIKSSDPLYFGFGETYCSTIKPGQAKAWKWHKKQTQNLCVVFGGIELVVVDTRDNSPTKNKFCAAILDKGENYNRATIRPNLWYGFKCLGHEEAIIINTVDFEHDKSETVVRNLLDKNMPSGVFSS